MQALSLFSPGKQSFSHHLQTGVPLHQGEEHLSAFNEPDRPGVQQHSVVDKIHENLALALKTRIESKRTGPEKQ